MSSTVLGSGNNIIKDKSSFTSIYPKSLHKHFCFPFWVIHQVAPHTPEHFSFSGAVDENETPENLQQGETPAQNDSEQRTGVDNVPQDESFEGYAAELRQCQSKMKNGTYSSIHPARPLNNVSQSSQNKTTQYKATFV